MDFAVWYEARHGREPFPWQRALAARVADDNWPDAVTVPTGSGKTAIIDIWLWAALGGHAVPRRLVYVIDRRVIVDSVTDYATALVNTLPVADRPEVVVMRGGITIEEDWLRQPLRPAIIVSTVDQVGSRLLFCGYGVSRRSAPVHAGLLGNDALIVLDEVHLAQPFLHTLRAISAYRGTALPLPWRILVMSATWAAGHTIGLTRADRDHPVLGRRLRVSKPAQLRLVPNGEDLAAALAEEASTLRAAGAAVIGIVCNRVARARAVFEMLSGAEDAVLLTGRIRPYDRDQLLAEYLPRMAAGTRASRGPLYVVATQTIEVGADLDFDAMVSECAPLSALRQRAGRLNRLGELDRTPFVIVHQPPARTSDPIYGDDLAKAWGWLKGSGEIDFGIAALDRLFKKNPAPDEQPPEAPLLLAAHIDLLSRTAVDHGINVAPWLHGWQDTSPDVYLSWRADFALDAVNVAPPVAHELLTVPIWALRQWSADIADVEGVGGNNVGGPEHSCVIWNGEEAIETTMAKVRVGDTVILPADAGGCDRYGWAPRSSASVPDVGDSAKRIRLHPAVHPELRGRIESLNDDPHTRADDWRALAVECGFTSPGRVRAYAGGCVVLARSEWTSHAAVKPISLRAHLRAVGKRARHFAQAAGLNTDLVNRITRAGARHDAGKIDERWQAMVGGGTPPLAKGPGGDNAWLTLPRGWRHEMLSATRQSDALVRYLVGTHHGYGRPLLPCAPDIDLWRTLEGWPEQVAALQSEYGPWGLAYLEALVRLADWTVSEEEQVCA